MTEQPEIGTAIRNEKGVVESDDRRSHHTDYRDLGDEWIDLTTPDRDIHDYPEPEPTPVWRQVLRDLLYMSPAVAIVGGVSYWLTVGREFPGFDGGTVEMTVTAWAVPMVIVVLMMVVVTAIPYLLGREGVHR